MGVEEGNWVGRGVKGFVGRGVKTGGGGWLMG